MRRHGPKIRTSINGHIRNSGRLAGKHPVCRRSEAVDVAETGVGEGGRRQPRIESGDLWSHCPGRADGSSEALFVHLLRETEVTHEHFITRVEEEVSRLDVTVDQPSVVDTRYPLTRFTCPADSLVCRHTYTWCDPVIDRPAGHDLGNDVATPLHHVGVEDREDELPTQAPQDLRFTPWTCQDVVREQLQRTGCVHRVVANFQNLPERPTAQLTDYLVAIRDDHGRRGGTGHGTILGTMNR